MQPKPARSAPLAQVASAAVVPRNVPRPLWADAERHFLQRGGLQSLDEIATFLSTICHTEFMSSEVHDMLLHAVAVESDRLKTVLEQHRQRKAALGENTVRRVSCRQQGNNNNNSLSSRRLTGGSFVSPRLGKSMLATSNANMTPSMSPQGTARPAVPNLGASMNNNNSSSSYSVAAMLKSGGGGGGGSGAKSSGAPVPDRITALPSLRLDPLYSSRRQNTAITTSTTQTIHDTLPKGHFGLSLPLNEESLVEATLAQIEPSLTSTTFDAASGKGLVTGAQMALLLSYVSDADASERVSCIPVESNTSSSKLSKSPRSTKNKTSSSEGLSALMFLQEVHSASHAAAAAAAAVAAKAALAAKVASTTSPSAQALLPYDEGDGDDATKLEFATLQRLLAPFGIDASHYPSLGEKAPPPAAPASAVPSPMAMSRTLQSIRSVVQKAAAAAVVPKTTFAGSDDVFSAVERLLVPTAGNGGLGGQAAAARELQQLHDTDMPLGEFDINARLTPVEDMPTTATSGSGGGGDLGIPLSLSPRLKMLSQAVKLSMSTKLGGGGGGFLGMDLNVSGSSGGGGGGKLRLPPSATPAATPLSMPLLAAHGDDGGGGLSARKPLPHFALVGGSHPAAASAPAAAAAQGRPGKPAILVPVALHSHPSADAARLDSSQLSSTAGGGWNGHRHDSGDGSSPGGDMFFDFSLFVDRGDAAPGGVTTATAGGDTDLHHGDGASSGTPSPLRRRRSSHQFLVPVQDAQCQTDARSFTQLWLGRLMVRDVGLWTAEAGKTVGTVVSLAALKANRRRMKRAEENVTLLNFCGQPIEALQRLSDALHMSGHPEAPSHGLRLVTMLKK